MNRLRRHLRTTTAVLAAAVAVFPAAAQAKTPPSPVLKWTDCGDGFLCSTAKVPLSYSKLSLGTYDVALIKRVAIDRAHRLGSLFTNPGGPGASGVDFVRSTADSLYANLNTRYDIIGFDPRGTGASGSALDCKANQETEGIYSNPFATPKTDLRTVAAKDAKYVAQCQALNKAVLPYVTTANVARDLNQLRQAVGEKKLNYLGFSYGTYLGATFAALFPDRVGRFVLDGPVDANDYANHPLADLDAQTAGFEDALNRFFAACKADQTACLGFGGTDPKRAYDRLIAKAKQAPIPADAFTDDPRPVTADEINFAVTGLLYAKFLWPYLAQDLALAEQGDGSYLRYDVDSSYGLDPATGTYDPGSDRYFLIGAVEQNYRQYSFKDIEKAGKSAFWKYPHAFYNAGYVGLNYTLFKTRGDGVFSGPFKLRSWVTTPLVVATTHDPATPYPGAKELVKDLGNARLLTMDGDNHTAYGGNSVCIDEAVDTYLLDGKLPPAGKRCQQDVPFAQPTPPPAADTQSARIATTTLTRDVLTAPHTKPVDLSK